LEMVPSICASLQYASRRVDPEWRLYAHAFLRVLVQWDLPVRMTEVNVCEELATLIGLK